jgi:RHS repeat-associated protein
LLAIRDAAGNHYYVGQDRLGSVRTLLKRDGTWQRSLRYGPYGAVVFDTAASGAPTTRYQWTGREYDAETGWHYFRARYYDRAQRRFVQEDPIGFAGGANLYAYVSGRVLEARDPSGLDDFWDSGSITHVGDCWIIRVPTENSSVGVTIRFYATYWICHGDLASSTASIPLGVGLQGGGGGAGGTGSGAGGERGESDDDEDEGDLSPIEQVIADVTPDWMVPLGACVQRYTSTPLGLGLLANSALSVAVADKGAYHAGASVRHSSWTRRVGSALESRGVRGAASVGRATGRVLFALTGAEGAYSWGIIAQCALGYIE